MDTIPNLLQLQKDKSEFYPFQLQIGDLSQQTYRNNYTGDPALPMLGKYSKNKYNLLEVVSLVAIPLIQRNDKFYNKKDQRIGEQEIHIPLEVSDLLNQIPEQIIHNKKTKIVKKATKKQPKKPIIEKPTQIFNIQQEIQEEQTLPHTQNNLEPELVFHPLQFTYEQEFEFIWTINVLESDDILPAIQKDPCLNYVTHNMVFEDFDFSIQKKLIQYIPVAIVRPYNIYEWQDVHNSLSFGQFRSEYLSTHLVQGSLCFSPNNMKIGVLDDQQVCTFWSVILRENNKHLVVYHWIVLDRGLSEMARQVAQQATSIQELIGWFQEDKYLMEEIQSLFK